MVTVQAAPRWRLLFHTRCGIFTVVPRLMAPGSRPAGYLLGSFRCVPLCVKHPPLVYPRFPPQRPQVRSEMSPEEATLIQGVGNRAPAAPGTKAVVAEEDAAFPPATTTMQSVHVTDMATRTRSRRSSGADREDDSTLSKKDSPGTTTGRGGRSAAGGAGAGAVEELGPRRSALRRGSLDGSANRGDGARKAEDGIVEEARRGQGPGDTKRRRLTWTPELHRQFLDALHQLGMARAVPKAILKIMNVPGMTRENVASHLQKYRAWLKKAQASTATPSSSPFPGMGAVAPGGATSGPVDAWGGQAPVTAAISRPAAAGLAGRKRKAGRVGRRGALTKSSASAYADGAGGDGDEAGCSAPGGWGPAGPGYLGFGDGANSAGQGEGPEGGAKNGLLDLLAAVTEEEQGNEGDEGDPNRVGKGGEEGQNGDAAAHWHHWRAVWQQWQPPLGRFGSAEHPPMSGQFPQHTPLPFSMPHMGMIPPFGPFGPGMTPWSQFPLAAGHVVARPTPGSFEPGGPAIARDSPGGTEGQEGDASGAEGGEKVPAAHTSPNEPETLESSEKSKTNGASFPRKTEEVEHLASAHRPPQAIYAPGGGLHA